MFAPAYSLRRIAKPARVLARPGLALLVLVGAAKAQTALEPADGGTDFNVQGEYSGKAGAVPFGAQVIALSSGGFRAVFYPGGLPGQGWTGAGRIECPGSRPSSDASSKATFSGGGYSAAIPADGTRLVGKTASGDSLALEKVMRKSPTEGAPAPSGAVVLFDGTGVSAWKDGTAGMDARKLFKPEGSSASSGAVTKQAFQSFTLHLEFRLPFMPSATGQRRGNSGIYLQGRDEVQVLDSFGNDYALADDTMPVKRECAAFFEYYRPSLNAAFPPLSWQTYDIEFTAGGYDATRTILLHPAVASVRWNGILVQDKRPLPNPTLLGDPVGPAPGPLRFQAYGDPVFYRNIWLKEGVSAVREASENRAAGSAEPAGATALLRADGRALRSADAGVHAAAGRYFSADNPVRGATLK